MVKVTHGDDVAEVRALGHEGVEDFRELQLRMVRRDGTHIWTEHRIVPLRNAEGDVVAATGIARDVTALKEREADLSHRALHDPLTGLPNRVLLLDRLEAALARLRRHQSSLAVLYLDLDRFKTVNDNLGHDVGDRVLQVVGQRVQQTLRPSDSVGRLGGDEFAVVLGDLHDPSEAMQVAKRLLPVVAEPVDLHGNTLVITVSIGVATAVDGDTSAAELLRRADFAMYTAKDRGRARVETYREPERPTTP
jgi:diguanylate cyclase (GGDEF)-like protein